MNYRIILEYSEMRYILPELVVSVCQQDQGVYQNNNIDLFHDGLVYVVTNFSEISLSADSCQLPVRVFFPLADLNHEYNTQGWEPT